MNQSKSDTLESLIKACRLGNRAAQFQFYQRYAKAMLNTSYRITNHREDAEDVLQEAFLKAFINLKYYRGESSLGVWLKRIVVNTAVSHLRKYKNEPFWEKSEDLPSGNEVENTGELMDDFSVDRAYQALHELPDGYRTVFSLYVLEGYDHQEIAEILGISVSTSISQLHRARKKLKKLLATVNQHG